MWYLERLRDMSSSQRVFFLGFPLVAIILLLILGPSETLSELFFWVIPTYLVLKQISKIVEIKPAVLQVGVYPFVLLFLILWFVVGWRFPGHCRTGDGIRCVPAGVIGFTKYICGMGSGGPFSIINVIFFFALICPLGLYLLRALSGSVFKIYQKLGRPLSCGLYSALALTLLFAAWSVKWNPRN